MITFNDSKRDSSISFNYNLRMDTKLNWTQKDKLFARGRALDTTLQSRSGFGVFQEYGSSEQLLEEK